MPWQEVLAVAYDVRVEFVRKVIYIDVPADALLPGIHQN
jgi:hypothetical protein